MADELITCPYNKFHQIRPSRIQYHLLKCKKNHPGADMVVCPFNASHHIQRQNEREHLLECRDKRMIEVQKYNEPLPGHHGYLNNPTVYGSAMIPMYNENQSVSGADLLRLDDTINSVSNMERNLANRSRIDGPRRHGASRLSSAERLPPVARSSRILPTTRGFRRSPSPALEGSCPDGPQRRSSPSPLRFSNLTGGASSYGSTSFRSYKS